MKAWLAKLPPHSGIVATGAVAFFALLRVLMAARGDLETAQALVKYSSTSGIVIAALLEAIPLAVAVAGVVLILPVLDETRHKYWALLLAPWLVAALYMVPLAFLLAVPAAWVGMWFRRPSAQSVSIIAAFSLVGLTASLVVQQNVWLPAERLERQRGEPVVGYVLGEEAAHLIVLRNRDREIVFVPHDSVTARTLCDRFAPSLISTAFRPLAHLVHGPPYRRCPGRPERGER